jgi:hypothetical protein
MATLDGIPLETLAAWLTEAQTAYHALSTGTQTVSVGTGDTRVTFTAAQVADLRRYIADLQAAISALSTGSRPRKGVYIIGGNTR